MFQMLSQLAKPNRTKMEIHTATNRAKRDTKKTKKRQASAQSLARRGRPCLYPESKILMQRAEISRAHAYLVVTGKRQSPKLQPMLAGIRAELAAKNAHLKIASGGPA